LENPDLTHAGSRPGSGRGPWATWLAFGLAYLALAEIADGLTDMSSQFSTFWPATGLYVGALLLSERRRWTGLVVAAAAADLVVSWHVGRRPLLAGAFVLGDALEALTAAILIQAVVRARPRMWRLRDLLAVIVLGAAVSPLVPALLGGTATHLTTGFPLWHASVDWWAGDSLGIVVVTPLLLAWASPDGAGWSPVRRRPLEFAALIAATLAVNWVVLRDAPRGVLAQEHLVLPVFAWAALRFGPRGVTACSAILAVGAAWATVRTGSQALAPDDAVVQLYLALSIVTALILAAEVAGRERSERKLKLARYALDRGAEAIVVASLDGRIVLASEGAGTLLARRFSDLVGAEISEIDPSLAARLGPDGWAKLRSIGTARYETTLDGAGGQRTPAEVNLAFLTLDGSDFLAWSARDLSERKRAEEEQRLAAVGTLAAGVAHEINNPLTYITSNLAFVEEALGQMRGLHPDVEEAVTATAEAAVGARRVRDIVRDLRFVARPPHGRWIAVDPVAEVRSALNLAQAEIVHRARLDLRLDPCPLVLAGQGQIGQVMLHLLVNASQSIPAGASADHFVRVVSGTDARGWTAIEVSDSGVGIPAAARQHVFEPFFTTRPTGGGSGLGLSVCHGIVTGLGGQIDLLSEEGRGTTVHVRFPPAGDFRGDWPSTPS
jgi:signal transduction histidine kinase